jgi:hypothetical protein
MPLSVTRSPHNPIVHPEMDERVGGNINGPSLIRVPDWIENPLGRYYLYFAHHQGQFIRMAHADDLLGPYTVHSPGVLDIDDTLFPKHIASPDVHIDNDNHLLRMWYHGAGFTGEKPDYLGQSTCYAESADGLSFATDHVCLGPSYMRVLQFGGYTYGFGGGGGRHLWRTENDRELFERGPVLDIEGEDFTTEESDVIYRMRHTAFHPQGEELDIYYSNVLDEPERIKRTTVDLRPDWTEWRGTQPIEILRTKMDYEGAGQPIEPSSGGASHDPVHQVRDPYVFLEDDRIYLVYSVAGEKGLGIAEIHDAP